MTATDRDRDTEGGVDEDARVEGMAQLLFDEWTGDIADVGVPLIHETPDRWVWDTTHDYLHRRYRRMARATLAHLDAERAEDEALLRDLWELLDSPPPSREWWPVMRRLHARLHGTYATGEEGADV
jgi:hypothetical protein